MTPFSIGLRESGAFAERRPNAESRSLAGPGASLGLGLAALGRPGYITLGHKADLRHDTDPEAMRAHCHTVLDAGWAGGIRYFDAARSYGRSEDFLGTWLTARGVTPKDAIIGSKWGYTYTADWRVDADVHEVKDHRLPVFERQIAETRSFLGRHLALYQIHSATLASGVLDDPAVLAALARLKSNGVAVGLTLSGAAQGETLARAIGCSVDGIAVFDAVQATWNLLEVSAGPALATAHDAGLAVIIKEALANGRLTRRNSVPEFASTRARLTAEAERLGTSLESLALAAALARPWADLVLSGAATVDQVEANITALAVPWDRDAEDALGAVAEDAHDYWQTRSALPWN